MRIKSKYPKGGSLWVRLFLFPITGMIAITSFTGCKPSERNYREAYDAARSKEAARREAIGADVQKFESLGDVRRINVDGREISQDFSTTVRLESSEPEGESAALGSGPLAVAVGRYSLPTNARAQAESLRKEYPGVSLAKDSDGRWWVIISRCADFQGALHQIDGFTSRHKDYPFPGLQAGEPTLIRIL